MYASALMPELHARTSNRGVLSIIFRRTAGSASAMVALLWQSVQCPVYSRPCCNPRGKLSDVGIVGHTSVSKDEGREQKLAPWRRLRTPKAAAHRSRGGRLSPARPGTVWFGADQHPTNISEFALDPCACKHGCPAVPQKLLACTHTCGSWTRSACRNGWIRRTVYACPTKAKVRAVYK